MQKFPILYSFRRCPYAMRARLAILSSGQSVELREILLREKAPEFLQTSPTGTVPCLSDQAVGVIDESLDIMLWALERNDPEAWLIPQEGSLEDMLALIATLDGDFKRHLDRYKYDTRYPDASSEGERQAASDILMKLEEKLAKSDWLLGSRAALADYAFLPFLRQFANVDRDWFEAQAWPKLLHRLKTFEASERFATIMPKFAVWKAGDEPILFPSQSET